MPPAGGSAELVRIGGLDGSPSPNDVAVTPIGLLGLDVDAPIGFDIAYDGTGYFTFNANGSAFITPVDLTTGAAKLIGSIGGGAALRAVAAAVPGGIRFTKSTYFALEGMGVASVSLSRTGDATDPLTVTFATSDGTATNADYTNMTKTVTFLPGQQTVNVSVPLHVDAADEPDETVTLTLSNPLFGARLSAPATATLRIVDSNSPDSAPTIQITSPTANPTFEAHTALITLTGTAADDGGIASVSWQTEAGVSGTATGTTAWTASNMPLSPGVNRITVWAIDTFGNSSTALLTHGQEPPLHAGGRRDGRVLRHGHPAGESECGLSERDAPVPDGGRHGADAASIAAADVAHDRGGRYDFRPRGGRDIDDGDVDQRVADRRRAHDAVGRDRLRRAYREGDSRSRVDLVFRGGIPGLLRHVPAPEQSQPVREHGVGGFPAGERRDRERVVSTRTDAAAHDPSGEHAGSREPVLRHRRALHQSWRGGARDVLRNTHLQRRTCSAGETAPATSWFLAEGATGDYFTTFVLLANPSPSDAELTLTYLPLSGTPLTKMTTEPAGQRRTINLQLEDSSLINTSVATRVDSTQPISSNARSTGRVRPRAGSRRTTASA